MWAHGLEKDDHPARAIERMPGILRVDQPAVQQIKFIDWYSRRVLSWRISNSMETVFCVDCLEDALRTYGKPEIFNSDQGSQFTLSLIHISEPTRPY